MLPKTIIKNIVVVKDDGQQKVIPIYDQDREYVSETYKQQVTELEEGDELFIQVASRANKPADEDSKYFIS